MTSVGAYDEALLRFHRTGPEFNGYLPKSRAGRRPIPLPGMLVEALLDHRKLQVEERLASAVWLDGDWMFPTRWGAVVDHHDDWEEFKAICKAAGLKPTRLHALRHSAATVMLAAQIDYPTAGAILGHSSVAQTSRYAHALADRKRAAADLIGDIYSERDASR